MQKVGNCTKGQLRLNLETSRFFCPITDDGGHLSWFECSAVQLSRVDSQDDNRLGQPAPNTSIIPEFHSRSNLSSFQDEIQKLASQIEWMKIVHMNIGNRHLKLKHSSAQYHIASSYFPPSPILRSLRRRSSDVPDLHTIRMSPAAELASERV